MEYNQGDIRTDHKDRMWCYTCEKEGWFIMRDDRGNDQFNTIIKKFELTPNQVNQYYKTPPTPVGDIRFSSINRRLDAIERMLEAIKEKL